MHVCGGDEHTKFGHSVSKADFFWRIWKCHLSRIQSQSWIAPHAFEHTIQRKSYYIIFHKACSCIPTVNCFHKKCKKLSLFKPLPMWQVPLICLQGNRWGLFEIKQTSEGVKEKKYPGVSVLTAFQCTGKTVVWVGGLLHSTKTQLLFSWGYCICKATVAYSFEIWSRRQENYANSSSECNLGCGCFLFAIWDVDALCEGRHLLGTYITIVTVISDENL